MRAATTAPRGHAAADVRRDASACATSRRRSPTFAARHPDVIFDLDLSDRTVDLVEEGFDLAIRIGAIRHQGWWRADSARPRLVCCAAPAYLAKHKSPLRSPEDLAGHECLSYSNASLPNVWQFEARDDGRRIDVQDPAAASLEQRPLLAALGAAGPRRAVRTRLHRRPGDSLGPARAAARRTTGRRARRSRPCIRAAVICRRKCERSWNSWLSASRARRTGGCRTCSDPRLNYAIQFRCAFRRRAVT